MLLALFVLFAMAQFLYYKRLQQIYQAFIARHFANQFAREGNLFRERISIPLQIITFSSLALFLYQTFSFFGLLSEITGQGFLGFVYILLGIILLWFVKLIVIRFSGFLFRTVEVSFEYSLSMLIYFIVNGLLLLPVVILIQYFEKEIFIYTGLVLSGIVFVLWIIRGFGIGSGESRFSVLHLFLYLCTVEFLPVLVLIKMILDN